MSYYDKFYEQLPNDSDSFPPYLFGMLDSLKNADGDIDKLTAEKEELEIKLSELEAKMQEVQKENLRLLAQAEDVAEVVEDVVEEADEILSLDEIVDGLLTGDVEIVAF